MHRPLLFTVFVASALAVTASTSPSAAQSIPKNPGDEVTVGPNQTGEACRLRMMDNPNSPASQFNLYCAGWTQRSAVMYRTRASREYPPLRLLMDTGFANGYANRLSACREPESTTLSDGTAAVLRECKWTNGGWPMLVLATVINRESFMVETLPTNLPVIERAIEVLSGKRKVDAIASAGRGTRSAAIGRAETMVGASGALVGVQDIGAHDVLVRLGELRYESGDEPGSEAAFRRALDIEERMLGKDNPASGRTLTYVARASGYQGRFDESLALFDRALPLVRASFVADHYPEHLAVHSGVERFRGGSNEALRLAEESVRIREARNQSNDTGLAHSLYHLAAIYNILGRYDDAQAAAGRALRIVQQAGRNPDKDLRAVSGASAATKPFIGFGDPAFTGAAGDQRSAAAIGALCRQGEPLDTELVRALPRLRETATELRRIAQALGAPADSVVLGNDVTESRVRAATLSDYKVIVFATHGLLPSELKCKAEPALALTPPAVATATEDGLLDASEIAQLRLDADWVVLSACNTAGPDGNLGGESLSGLARAFFYAGARTLLVSHWAVASRATVALTTGMFSTYAKSPTQGRAGALAQAQRALQDDKHPFFWAPFVLVGDGGSGPGS